MVGTASRCHEPSASEIFRPAEPARTLASMRAAIVLAAAAAASAMTITPRAIVDLGLAPSERWNAVVNASLTFVPFSEGMQPIFASHNASLFNNVSLSQFELLWQSLREFWPERAQELAGLASAISSHPRGGWVSPQYLAGWVWFHELAHTELSLSARPKACTGVLVADAAGSVFHGRNMDQDPHQVRNLTVQMTFVDDKGDVVFEAVDWYWITTGVMTAVKAGVASMQENWRYGGVPSGSVFSAAQQGTMPQVFLFRETLQNASFGTPFSSVVSTLSQTPLAAPMYAVVAGVGAFQGVVITRQCNGTVAPSSHGLAWLSSSPPRGVSGVQFLVQTNYDRWLPDPPSDPRRTVAEQFIESMVSVSDAASLYGVMAVVSDYPVFNEDTAYTALLRPQGEPSTLWSVIRRSLSPSQ
jgi:N-acylethanolamine-hydrolysing acid amidase